MANLQIIFQECGNSSKWVAQSGKIMQICRFAGYVGNGLMAGQRKVFKVRTRPCPDRPPNVSAGGDVSFRVLRTLRFGLQDSRLSLMTAFNRSKCNYVPVHFTARHSSRPCMAVPLIGGRRSALAQTSHWLDPAVRMHELHEL